MKMIVDGELVEMTDEQSEEIKDSKIQKTVSQEERMKALEMAVADLAVKMIGV